MAIGIVLMVLSIVGMASTYIVEAMPNKTNLQSCLMLVLVLIPSLFMCFIGSVVVAKDLGYGFQYGSFIVGCICGSITAKILYRV